MATFKQWLNQRPEIKKKYQSLNSSQQQSYKSEWEAGGKTGAKKYLDSVLGSGGKETTSLADWLNERPQIKEKYNSLKTDEQRQTYEDIFNKSGAAKAKYYLDETLMVVSPDTSTTEIGDVTVPTPTKYPVPTLIPTKGFGITQPKYTTQTGIAETTAGNVGDIRTPSYASVDPITGAKLKRVDKVGYGDYEGAEGINSYTADDADYSMVDPMSFASKYGDFYRGEVLKNASLSDQIALQQLDTELGGLTDYAAGAAALKRQETSIDNTFNQAQRLAQVQQAIPDVAADLAAQRERANAYAEGRLPDEMEDRMMELSVRSKSADATNAAGFGSGSLASQKASTLMSAEQRLGVAQMGEQLLGSNVQARANLYLAPTQYSEAGSGINVMPSQSASVLAASSLGQLNELANVSSTTALGTRVGQEQFVTGLANDISKFNASIQQDTEKFNSSLAENQAQYKATRQTQIDEFNAQMAASENLSEAEIEQRTSEFNAGMATRESEFQATMQSAIDTFNANKNMTQNQFNASMLQRTKEFNSNTATTENQFVASLGLRVGEFNATLGYNTALANAGIENTYSIGNFDYNVTYKGLIAGLLNADKQTKLQLKLAEKELGIYNEAMDKEFEARAAELEAAKTIAESEGVLLEDDGKER